jgi:hypothetical protein
MMMIYMMMMMIVMVMVMITFMIMMMGDGGEQVIFSSAGFRSIIMVFKWCNRSISIL